MKFPRLCSLLLTVGLLSVLFVPSAQAINSINLFESKTFVASDGTQLPYRLYVPEEDALDSEEPIPILTFLHGAGERGDDNLTPLRSDCAMLDRIVNNPRTYPCIVLVPQCSQSNQWVNKPWESGLYSLEEVAMSSSLKAVKELQDQLEAEYNIDPNRRYLTGFSMGGFATWDLLARYPRHYAAALPICGVTDPLQAPRLLDIPIRTYHGTADPSVNVQGTRAMAAAMKTYDARLFSYTELEGADHGIWGDIYRDSEVLEWLFQQRRDETHPYWGDVNLDKTVDASDALLVLQHSVNIIKLEYEDFKVADVSANNKVTATDALLILQYVVKLTDKFPAERK